jgi:hypothetical protein
LRRESHFILLRKQFSVDSFQFSAVNNFGLKTEN